jgi:hypothetical protein
VVTGRHCDHADIIGNKDKPKCFGIKFPEKCAQCSNVHDDKGYGSNPINLFDVGLCLSQLLCGDLHTISFQHSIFLYSSASIGQDISVSHGLRASFTIVLQVSPQPEAKSAMACRIL